MISIDQIAPMSERGIADMIVNGWSHDLNEGTNEK
jgi:hypothetical protein